MNPILFIILFLVVLGASITLLGILFYNKYQEAMIKISEAENNIDFYLQKKLDFMVRVVPLLKEELTEGLEEIEKVLLLKSKKLNNYELNEGLAKYLHAYLELRDLNGSLDSVEALHLLTLDILDNEDDLDAAKQYYNDNVGKYNKLARSFPSNLVGLVFHYKQKEFYQNEKQEMFEILKK